MHQKQNWTWCNPLERIWKIQTLKRTKIIKDDDELFCDLLSSQLKQLPDNIIIMVKMQIYNMIYNQLLQISNPIHSWPICCMSVFSPSTNTFQWACYSLPTMSTPLFILIVSHSSVLKLLYCKWHYFIICSYK